ncbi:Laminin subunit alpha-2 [Wickerhamomyces ciferrii]|uniref:Laminin subunit alpha-2 n=1 Tax=Wickerhamomyces ciferrii (strain ATCC 14091 / BCRC 22168 / CBS 111 / JCM 3599 / NBRC 0793 / NRRL Y-1031 F-60-10) TaxID=1206466 RepID=K0KW09_WICCF|nr:Laminin subunit alpha-2 [Wickerhamomyces ciferrii]CCH45308.1 Laminin subunit alpha-2 [Wickerhamomyces ciferrii]
MEYPKLKPRRSRLQDETLESISNFNDLSLNNQLQGSPRNENIQSGNGIEVKHGYLYNGSDIGTSINVKSSKFDDSNYNSIQEHTIDHEDGITQKDGDEDGNIDDGQFDENTNEVNEYWTNETRDGMIQQDQEANPEFDNDQDQAESNDDDGEDDEDEDEDDDDANEFLNSSTFLSNSQIIRSKNLNNLQSINHRSISSPTPALKNSTPKHKTHFNFNKSRIDSSQLSDNSDQSGDEQNDENRDYNNKSTIDLDNPNSTPKIPKMHPDTTPWRKLRPASALHTKDQQSIHPLPSSKANDLNFMKSLFDENTNEVKSPIRSVSLFETGIGKGTDSLGSTTVGSSFEVESLKKQITSYKLQQRLLTEFIRNIMNSTGNSEEIKNDFMERLERENNLLFSERSKLQKDLKNNQKAREEDQSSKLAEKDKEIVELKNDLITTCDLNNDLNSYIDEIKARADQQGALIDKSNEDSDRWESLVNEILTLLLDVLKGESAKAVLQARDQSSSLDTKLKVISLAINEILKDYKELSNNLSKMGDYNIDEVNSFISETKDKLSNSHAVENELKSLLQKQSEASNALKHEFIALQNQFKENLLFVASLKKLLGEKRDKIGELNGTIIRLESELEDQSNQKSLQNGNEKETQLLKNRINIIKTNHSKDLEKMNAEIDNLRLEIDELRNKPSRDLKPSTSHDLLKQKQDEIYQLTKDVEILQEELESKDDQVNGVVSNLKSLVRQSKDDYDALVQDYHHLQQQFKDLQSEKVSKDKEYRRKLEHAAKELNLAVAKQRSLAAEKSKLTFSLEDSKREHSLLKLNNSTLTEKVGKLSYQVSTLTNYELGFNSLFQSQVTNFENLLHHFDSILEESSVHQAQQKLNKLLDSHLDFDQAQAVMRSLTSYFENATSSLIADHSQLLINSNVENKESQDELNKLRDQVDSLTEELQWYIVNFRDRNDLSPRSKLRIEELERRKKAERERRKLENEASAETIRRLEKENSELREKLKQLR